MYQRGIVEKISIKTPRSGEYGRFANYGIKIGDNWFNGTANEDKVKKVIVVKDSNHNEVTDGMEIEFMYETNDKGYHDIEQKTMKILSGSKQPVQGVQKPVGALSEPITHANTSLYIESLKSAIMLMEFANRDKEVPTTVFEDVFEWADRILKKAQR